MLTVAAAHVLYDICFYFLIDMLLFKAFRAFKFLYCVKLWFTIEVKIMIQNKTFGVVLRAWKD